MFPEQVAGGVRELDVHAALGHAHDQTGDLDVHDLTQLLAGERSRLDDVVEKTVDGLRLEREPPRPSRPPGMFDVVVQDGVLEVHGAALAVGEAAVVHHLQEHVEDVAVGLLDLVEQDDACTDGGAPPP